MDSNDKVLISEEPLYLRKGSESADFENIFGDTHYEHPKCKDNDVENKKQDTIKKEESKTTFEMPSAGGISEAFRKASILGTPVFQGMENKFFDMQELTLEKSKFEETDLHEAKDIRERRLDSFSNYEENTCKQDYRKSSEEIEKPKQEPVNPGLLIQINKSKMTNNEGGAVTVQNNMIVINKKRKQHADEVGEQEACTIEGLQYINDIITNISNRECMPIDLSMYKVGCLTLEERRLKIMKYKEKRMKRTWSKKISYDCRKRVADNRLRVKGRFVTKDQAFALLGMTPQDLCDNESIKQLLTDSSCSIVTTTNNIKIRNIQTLLQSSQDKPEMQTKPGIDVEIVSQNKSENTVEVKFLKKK